LSVVACSKANPTPHKENCDELLHAGLRGPHASRTAARRGQPTGHDCALLVRRTDRGTRDRWRGLCRVVLVITLNGQVYRAVRDLDGRHVVIVRRGSQWRVARPSDAVKVLAGLRGPMLRVVT
jgi:hypothetical protein